MVRLLTLLSSFWLWLNLPCYMYVIEVFRYACTPTPYTHTHTHTHKHAHTHTHTHTHTGLRREDLYIEDQPDVKEALRRLPEQEQYLRLFRIKRALDLSLKHSQLPSEQWTKPEEVCIDCRG